MGEPEESYAQVRLFTRNDDDEQFQQSVYTKHELGKFIYLLDLMNSVFDKVTISKHTLNVQKDFK